MTRDQNTQNYLSLFQSVTDPLRSIVQKLNWVNEPATIPDDLMKWMFIHHGMPFPSWITEKRNLPARFEEFHAKRHTVNGFVDYFSSVVGADPAISIDVSQAIPRSLFFFGVAGVGLPNAEMLEQSGQIDPCFYLYKDQPVVITIDTDNAQVADFISQTAKLEVPFGDDPNCEIAVNVI